MTSLTGSGVVVAKVTQRVDDLIVQVREAVRRGLPPESTAYLVAGCLASSLGARDLLIVEQHEGHPDRYRQHVLHAEEDGSFSIVALVWLPGQRTPIHDHVCWCVTGVHEGQELEHRYRLMTDGRTSRLVPTETVHNPTGSVVAFAPPGDIHQVCNGGSSKAISVHVYGANVAQLGTSIRRVYDLPEGDR
ncbi:cysteine dioxygenase family protein [Streptomyces sp. RB6PN25]|uniref:Cysteine dioxygenase family protein n=1 Tax=Streptomyces humicola TaxID=2953240 RepID=A0ABT1PPL5_9ACTN|nr:cysteine dioxygenase family protein [Streptomyces humicola]MCQ4079058.1 cysteine dioxygenase family protein [Streptomyces humicola]